jgi:hypothetical protein
MIERHGGPAPIKPRSAAFASSPKVCDRLARPQDRCITGDIRDLTSALERGAYIQCNRGYLLSAAPPGYSEALAHDTLHL